MFAGTASLCWTLLFVGVFVLVSPEQKIITAESGHTITLPCRAPNNKIIVVEWSRADLDTKDVLLYRYDHFAPALQDPSFKNRVDLQDRQMKDGDVSLILKDVTTADSGTYECRVYVEGTRLWQLSIIYLRVAPPDQKNIITAESGRSVTLPCRAPNNNIISLEWNQPDLGDKYVLLYQDESFDPDNQHPSFKNRVELQDRQMKDGDVSLILKDVTINDAGTYECRVFMEGTRSWQLSSIYLIVVPPEQKIIIAESGQSITLPCRAPNNNIISLEWNQPDLGDKYVLLYQDESFDPDNQHPHFKNRVDLQDRQMKDGDVSLILKDVTTADSGTYECRVYVEGTRSWQLSIIYLRVAPPVQKNIPAEFGQDVSLPCRAPNNNNYNRGVEWSRADLEPGYVLFYQYGRFDTDNQHPSFRNRVDLQDRQMKDGDVSLILKNVTINDAGTYECRVFMTGTNRRKRAVDPINIINLRVVVPPGPPGGPTEDGSVGLSVFPVVAAVAVAAVVGFVIYKKNKKQNKRELSFDQEPEQPFQSPQHYSESDDWKGRQK